MITCTQVSRYECGEGDNIRITKLPAEHVVHRRSERGGAPYPWRGTSTRGKRPSGRHPAGGNFVEQPPRDASVGHPSGGAGAGTAVEGSRRPSPTLAYFWFSFFFEKILYRPPNVTKFLYDPLENSSGCISHQFSFSLLSVPLPSTVAVTPVKFGVERQYCPCLARRL